MLTAQQAAAKEAAHQKFGVHISFNSVQVIEYLPSNCDPSLHDKAARFAPGIEGIGIADDILRVYVLQGHTPDVEIPHEIEGLRTERVSSTGFRLRTSARRSALSPIPCGVSAGHHRISAGTLGCLVDIPNSRCILSNNHVLAHSNAGKLGDDIMQPSPYDHTPTNPARRVAGLTDYEPFVFSTGVNHIDAAIAALDDPGSAIPEIMTIGRPVNPPVPAFLNQSVAKHGRTTGLTFGTVVDISFDGNVDIDGRPAYFEDQIAIVGTYGPFSDGGDSGSLVLDNPGSHPVGLLFAGDNTHTLANPIRAVLNRFGATIVAA